MVIRMICIVYGQCIIIRWMIPDDAEEKRHNIILGAADDQVRDGRRRPDVSQSHQRVL